MTADQAADTPEMLETAFHDRVVAAGGTVFENAIGYAVPLWYSTPDEEYWAVRKAVGAMDFSFIRKFDVRGPGAIETVNWLITRDISNLAPGRIAYGAIVDESGMMMDDVVILAFSPDHVRITCGTAEVGELLATAAEAAGQTVTDERIGLGHLCIQGPNSRALLQKLTDQDVSAEAFPYYGYRTEVQISGVTVHVNRLGFTSELGYELWVSTEDAGAVWDAVFAAGEPLGIKPIGVLAVFMLRIEAGMIMGEGLDYDSTVSPFECRMGWAIDWDKGDFRGRAALLEMKDAAPKRLVTVKLPLTTADLSGAALDVDGAEIGRITMAMPSPQFDATLALVRVDRDHGAIGTAVRALFDGGSVVGEIVGTPYYDPERTRVRS